jgi:hypothetical protein
MQTAANAAVKTSRNSRSLRNAVSRGEKSESEPSKLLTRIGSATYKVSIRFSETSKETIEDKILKLVERGAENA